MTSTADADRNLKEFINRYGPEGFLILYFTNYLFELTMHFLHSRGEGDKDTSQLYYVYRGEVYSPAEIEGFEKELKRECSKRARTIVDFLKERDLLDKLTVESLKNPRISALLQENLESILEEISEV